MPNIYVPEEVFKKYVDKYGYNDVKEKMVDLLKEFIIKGKHEISKVRVG